MAAWIRRRWDAADCSDGDEKRVVVVVVVVVAAAAAAAHAEFHTRCLLAASLAVYYDDDSVCVIFITIDDTTAGFLRTFFGNVVLCLNRGFEKGRRRGRSGAGAGLQWGRHVSTSNSRRRVVGGERLW